MRVRGICLVLIDPDFLLERWTAAEKFSRRSVVLHGKDFAEARAHAHEIAAEKGLAYIDGYDDPAIIAGQGTMGIEIIDQVKDVDAVIVPVGGAGLIAGVSAAVKATRTRSRIRELGCLNRRCLVHRGNAEPRAFRATSGTVESARRRNLRCEMNLL